MSTTECSTRKRRKDKDRRARPPRVLQSSRSRRVDGAGGFSQSDARCPPAPFLDRAGFPASMMCARMRCVRVRVTFSCPLAPGRLRFYCPGPPPFSLALLTYVAPCVRLRAQVRVWSEMKDREPSWLT